MRQIKRAIRELLKDASFIRRLIIERIALSEVKSEPLVESEPTRNLVRRESGALGERSILEESNTVLSC